VSLNLLLAPTALIAAVLFAAGLLVERSVQSRAVRRCALVAELLLAIPGLLFVVHYTHLFDRAMWFYQLRAAPGSELAAAGMGMLAGALYAWFAPETFLEKAAIPGVLLLLIAPYAKPILAPLDLDQLRADCPGEVCLQSTPSTRGPASAATLLKALGQPASERELALECFTYRGGTENWYLARAFRRRGFRTEFLTSTSSWPCPSIAGVTLRGGAGHFIAILIKRQTPSSSPTPSTANSSSREAISPTASTSPASS